MLGYALALELFGARRPLRMRLYALWSAALFLACRALLGYGALHSGVYADPLTEPARFVLRAGQRLPVFLSAWGRAGWDVARDLTVAVEIEPGLAARTPSVRCGPAADVAGPSDAGLLDLAKPGASSQYFTVRAPSAPPSWALSVAVVNDRAGQLWARVCRVAVAALDLPTACAAAREPECASDGRLVLNAFPLDPRALWLVRAPACRVRRWAARAGRVLYARQLLAISP